MFTCGVCFAKSGTQPLQVSITPGEQPGEWNTFLCALWCRLRAGCDSRAGTLQWPYIAGRDNNSKQLVVSARFFTQHVEHTLCELEHNDKHVGLQCHRGRSGLTGKLGVCQLRMPSSPVCEIRLYQFLCATCEHYVAVVWNNFSCQNALVSNML